LTTAVCGKLVEVRTWWLRDQEKDNRNSEKRNKNKKVQVTDSEIGNSPT
jgi:hypothetical protein